MGEFVLATVSGAGSRTALVSEGLLQYFPNDVSQLNAWVYGRSTADVGNRGVERRASAWVASSVTLTLHAPGFPVAVTMGDYEIHTRHPRARKLRAINEAVAQLGLLWWREFYDDSLVGAANTWRYTLPATQNWAKVTRIEIERNPAQPTYPYGDASALNPRVERRVAADGTETWEIQFGSLPPPGRRIRVYGEGWFPELSADTDTLGIGGKWAGAAEAWVYDYAQYLLTEWERSRNPGQAADQKLRLMALDRLVRAKERLLERISQEHPRGKIVVPGVGDGQYSQPSEPRYLGVFRSEAQV